MKIIFTALATAVAVTLSACQTLPSNQDLAGKVDAQLTPLIKSCTSEPDAEQAYFTQSTISFTIGPRGFAKNFSYQSNNDVPPKLVSCLEQKVVSTNWPFAGNGDAYMFSRSVNWKALEPDSYLWDYRLSVKKVLESSRPQMFACAKTYRGRIDVKFEVDNAGRVSNSEVGSKENVDPKFFACIKSLVDSLKMPPAPRKQTVLIERAIIFRDQDF